LGQTQTGIPFGSLAAPRGSRAVTEQQRQEMISREFLRILASAHGYKVMEHQLDHGVDMVLCQVSKIERGGRTRYLDSQFKLDFQLKSTTPAGVIDDENTIRYDLEARAYNDLVHRSGDVTPLRLVLVILNDAPPACVEIDETRLSLLGRAYWYLPEEDAPITDNTATIRISIPKVNLLSGTFVQSCYEAIRK
jgi:hypothetical protein